MTRRGRSEGSIFQAADHRWTARVSLGFGPDGKRRRREYRAQTKTKAREWLTDAIDKLRDKKPIPPERLTVSGYVNEWLDTVVKPNLRPATAESYRILFDKHLKPWFEPKRMKLKELSASEIRQYIGANLRSCGN